MARKDDGAGKVREAFSGELLRIRLKVNSVSVRNGLKLMGQVVG